jgi:hypothetical protein
MKAITLWQPYASLVGLDVKRIETRSWSTKYRGPLAIHAGRRCEVVRLGQFNVEKDNPRGTEPAYLLRGDLAWPYRLPLGAVVATCDLVDVVSTDRVAFVPPTDPWVVEKGWHPARGDFDCTVAEAQRSYGDYSPGRFAWLLENIQPIDPVPATGHQGLWEWDR